MYNLRDRRGATPRTAPTPHPPPPPPPPPDPPPPPPPPPRHPAPPTHPIMNLPTAAPLTLTHLPRTAEARLAAHVPPKMLLLEGPRGSGKTTLLHRCVERETRPVRQLSGADPDDRRLLEGLTSSDDYAGLLRSSPVIVIDELQRLRDPGLTIKLLVDIAQSRLDAPPLLFAASDTFPGVNNLNWIKTLGSVRTVPVLPPSLPELSAAYGPEFVAAHMEAFVRFGTLPIVLPALGDPERAAGILRGFVATTLLEDALRARRLRRKDLLLPALKLFAEAIARPLRITAVARKLASSRDVADRLLTALAMTHVLRMLTPSGLALRWEPDVDETRIPALEKGFMADFADTGVRNAVLDLARGNEGSAFAPLADRPDREALWAAFVRQELSKVWGDVELFGTFSFWRTKRTDGSIPPASSCGSARGTGASSGTSRPTPGTRSPPQGARLDSSKPRPRRRLSGS